MPHIAVIPGDGIGTEVIEQGVRLLESMNRPCGLNLTFEHLDWGAERYLRDGSTLPEDAVQHFTDSVDAIYLGALGDPRVASNIHARDILLGLRFQLDLFINLRPIRLLDARYCPLAGKTPDDVDIMVFRENTEGLYTGIGGQFKRDTPDEVAIEAEMNTRKGVERIVRAAFAYAHDHGHDRVCMADKANAMRHGHDLWQRVYRDVASEYPRIDASHRYVDVLCMDLVRCPEQFQVIVTNNLFGDIVTDLGAAIQGGIGLAASGNIHPGRVSLFEPVHGSAPDIAGQGIANPIAALLSAGMLLAHIGRPDLDQAIGDAVKHCLQRGLVTAELGGTLSTSEGTQAVLDALQI